MPGRRAEYDHATLRRAKEPRAGLPSMLRVIGCRMESVCRFFFQAEDGIRDLTVTGVQTCALPISVTWTKVFSGQSCGQTVQLESYAFPTAAGRYVRIVGHGNSTSAWNSITEVAILDRKSVV